MQYLSILGDDNKKIGMFTIGLAFLLELSGIMAFFNRRLLLLANLCFLFGIYLFVGFSGLLTFFGQRSRLKASAIYFIGLVMIVVVHLSFIGTLVQGLGLFVIFRGYLSAIYGWVCRIPYIGKYLRSYKLQDRLDRLAQAPSAI